jgi:hypothetical protein
VVLNFCRSIYIELVIYKRSALGNHALNYSVKVVINIAEHEIAANIL